MPRTIALALALVAALIIVPPAADAGTSLARQVAQALKLAKRADKRATAALAASKPGPAGPSGAAGLNGYNRAKGTPGPQGGAGASAPALGHCHIPSGAPRSAPP